MDPVPAAEPTEDVEPVWSALLDELVLGVEEELVLGDVLLDWSELLGIEDEELLLVPGVVLVVLLCEELLPTEPVVLDCELMSLEEELLGLLLAVVSGLEVLPAVEPVVLLWLGLLPTLDVALDSGMVLEPPLTLLELPVLDAALAVCEALVSSDFFLSFGVWSGVAVVLELEPALPEMLPAVF